MSRWISLLLVGCSWGGVSSFGCSSSTALEAPSAEPQAPRGGSRVVTTAPTHLAQTPEAPRREQAEKAPESTTALSIATEGERRRYAWLDERSLVRSLERSFLPPPGYARVAVAERSFGEFLRGLPLRAPSTPVRAYDGSLLREGNDPRVAAVAELDVSKADLQQCADSVMRLHAEWLWSEGRTGEIAYHFVSGDRASFSAYAAGDRPKIDGPKVSWARSASPDASRRSFRRYLELVFSYASTISLARTTRTVASKEISPGDFLVLPGGPGHAILILDVAENDRGERVALLGQGFMPAQDFHVLHAGGALGAWFPIDGDIMTPFWPAPFGESSLRRFP